MYKSILTKSGKSFLAIILAGVICAITGSDAEEGLPCNCFLGLKGVGVVIEDLPAKAHSRGLSEEKIKKQVVTLLHKSDITVFSEPERLSRPRAPYLYISINPLISEKHGVCAVAYSVSFKQNVWLVGDCPQICVATTWNTNAVSLTGLDILSKAVEDNLSVFIDQFICEFQKRHASPGLATNKHSNPLEDSLGGSIYDLLDPKSEK